LSIALTSPIFWILACGYRRSAHALADRNSGVLSFPPGISLQNKLIAVQHVEIYRGEWRASRVDPVGGVLE
jgi:hypothetical protein